MKKLIFICLLVALGACKKEKDELFLTPTKGAIDQMSHSGAIQKNDTGHAVVRKKITLKNQIAPKLHAILKTSSWIRDSLVREIAARGDTLIKDTVDAKGRHGIIVKERDRREKTITLGGKMYLPPVNSFCLVLYTWDCNADGEDCNLIGTQVISCWTDDGGGNTGGGGDPPPSQCTTLKKDIEAELNSGTILAETESSIECGRTDTTINRCYTWKVFTVSGGLIPMYLKSHDKGIQVYNGGWRFSRLEHQDIANSGTQILYDVKTTNVDAISTIPAGGQTAQMYLRFTIEIHFICDELPVLVSRTVVTQNSWNVSD